MTASAAGNSKQSPLHLIICTVGICGCYLIYGVLQERFFSEKQLGATFLLLTQCSTNTTLAHFWQQLSESTKRTRGSNDGSTKGDGSLNHPLFLLTSFCYVCAMASSNIAIAFVSYPAVVLAKSTKLLPTMLMGTLIESKRYKWTQWLSATMLSSGIALFHLAATNNPHKSQKEDSLVGILLLIISLTLDGCLGACQGLLKRQDVPRSSTKARQRPPTAVETMLWVNLYAVLFLFPASVFTGQWFDGWNKLIPAMSNHAMAYDRNAAAELWRGLFYLNGAAACGQIFIFLTITWFSPLVTTTITTTRKFFTILLSVNLYGHVFTTLQWTGIGMVFGGLYFGIAVSSSTTTTTTTPMAVTQGDSSKLD